MKISAVIISYNAAKTIGQCLESLHSVADEIIVIDSFSDDPTPQICAENQTVFIQRKFTGYGDQKNFGIAQSRYSYILSLDADEYLSANLQNSIKKIKQSKGIKSDAYQCKLVNLYKGKALKYGIASPETKMRLWDKNKGLWNMDKVHEKVVFMKPPVMKFLKGNIRHHYHNNLQELRLKNNHYAQLGARKMFETKKQILPLGIFIKRYYAFIKAYFFKLGCLDLEAGYELAHEYSRYTSLKYTILYQMNKTKA